MPHPGLLALHSRGIGADYDDDDPRWRLFAAAISPRLDHRALCHDVDRDDLKLFAFLFYFAHSDKEAETSSARRLRPFEVEALVATHFALRNAGSGRAAAEVGWVSANLSAHSKTFILKALSASILPPSTQFPGILKSYWEPLLEPRSLRAAHLNSLYVMFPVYDLSAALNHPCGDPSIFLPSRNHDGRLFQTIYSDLAGPLGPSIWSRENLSKIF